MASTAGCTLASRTFSLLIKLIAAILVSLYICGAQASVATSGRSIRPITTNPDHSADCIISGSPHINSTSTMSLKRIKTAMRVPGAHWVGDGFRVNPVFADMAFTKAISPFLMFDYGAPHKFEPSKRPRGVGQHPHRGFETVTIAFQGEVTHKDSTGESDTIGPGDVQWMTAGRGIIHEEFHSEKLTKNGGVFEMAQLWVNLPSKYKMTKPRYQAIVKDAIASTFVSSSDGTVEQAAEVKIIAGEYGDVRGPAQTFTPINMFDVDIKVADVDITLSMPEGFNTIIFVRTGTIEMADKDGVRDISGQVVLLERNGTAFKVKAKKPNTSIIILGGEPIDEPIAHRGPFVMNTKQELLQCIKDFHMGNFGS